MGKQTTVIIGFAEALSAPEVAWSLTDSGFSVIAFARKGRRSALRHSRFVRIIEVTSPEVSLAQAQEEVGRLIANIQQACVLPVALMPLDDPSVWLCGKVTLPARTILVGPFGAALELALDKRRQIESSIASGFAVPACTFVNRVEDLAGAQLSFPVVFKPSLAAADSQGSLRRGRGWVCADRAELSAAVELWAGCGPMLLQQYVMGVGEGIFGLATAKGVVAWSAHRRVRMMNPEGSGSSACTGVSHIDHQSRAATERFLHAAGWQGLFMIEMLRDASGKLWFIELNGRCWGSMALARRSGLEYPAWAVQLAINPEAMPPLPQVPANSPMLRHLAREIIHVLLALRGPKSKALVRWPSVWRTLWEVCRFGRKDYWYNWRRDDPQVFFGDLWETLRTQFVESRRKP